MVSDNSEMVFTTVSLPEGYELPDPPKEPEKKTRRRQCRICKHESREAIEVISLNGDTFAANARLVTKEFGIKVDGEMLKNHMVKHAMEDRARQVGLLLRELRSDDEPLLTSRGLVKLMLAQALSKIVRGEIEIRNINDVVRLIQIDEQGKKSDFEQMKFERQIEAETGYSGSSAEEAMRQLGYVMNALRETVPEQYLTTAIKRAWSLGLGEDIASLAEVPLYQLPEAEGILPDLDQVAKDYEELGRVKTRQELEAEGYFERDDDVPPGE